MGVDGGVKCMVIEQEGDSVTDGWTTRGHVRVQISWQEAVQELNPSLSNRRGLVWLGGQH